MKQKDSREEDRELPSGGKTKPIEFFEEAALQMQPLFIFESVKNHRDKR